MNSDYRGKGTKVVVVRSRAIDPGAAKVAKALSESDFEVRLLLWDRAATANEGGSSRYVQSNYRLRAPYDSISIALYLPIWWLHELEFIFKTNPDVVHVFDLDTLLPGVIFKLLRRKKLFYTILDFYSANFPPEIPAVIRGLISILEKIGVGLTDVLFLPHECRLEQVEGARPRKVVIMNNSPPDALPDGVVVEAGWQAITTLFYAGLLHKSRGLRQVIETVKEIDGVRLLIAGDGPERGYIEAISRRDSPKVQYLGQIPYSRVIEETRKADVLFAFYDPSIPNSRYASPNKVFEAMMCGKPIIVNSEIAASTITREEDCGVMVPYGDSEAIRTAIRLLKNRSDLRKKLGTNGRTAYEERYDWRIMEQRLLDAYKAAVPSYPPQTVRNVDRPA